MNTTMKDFLSFLMGLFFGLAIMSGVIYITYIKPCEQRLPRNQHCKLTAVVDDDPASVVDTQADK